MLKKKIFLLIYLIVGCSLTSAQVPKNSWIFTFGIKYPRLVNHSYTRPDPLSAGGFFGFQRNFSEHVGLRLALNYHYLHGVYGIPEVKGATHAFDISADLLYYFIPCEPVSPYFFFGGGPVAFILENPPAVSSDFNAASQFNTGLGLEWYLDSDLKIKTEFAYSTVFDDKFDGSGLPVKGGILGSSDKSYFSVNLGLNYFLEKGEDSKYCQIYNGVSADLSPVDYERIEEIVKKYIPQEVVKEVVVEKPLAGTEKWILVGVNFEFNSVKIAPSSYPILYDAAKTLLKNPQMKVEIQGYTDNIGSSDYNLKLSQKRAEAVKSYLVSKGVNANRLEAVGYGENDPVADNKTADGRAMNRRIEFKIK